MQCLIWFPDTLKVDLQKKASLCLVFSDHLIWISDEILPVVAFDVLLHELFFSFILCLLQMMEFYERVSGARMHAAYVRPGGVALVSV